MRKRIWVTLVLVGIAGLLSFQSWQVHLLKGGLADLKWDLAVQGHNDDNVITPDVGTIQFLKRGGYSIQLIAATYTADGLHLDGFVGNPTNLWISGLSLKVSATKNLYEYRDDFQKNEFSFFFGPQSIGEAQCSPIASLGPGAKQPFSITIPNVKQTKEGLRLTVEFTGERYSYTP